MNHQTMEKLLINKEMTRTKKKDKEMRCASSYPSHRFSKWKYIEGIEDC